ncbi:FG-GAP-like repeat-containing protein [Chitinophaga tropicalis]|nr:FG-GAP-like repeat-containing protein [Chitinophaga tropicalis]
MKNYYYACLALLLLSHAAAGQRKRVNKLKQPVPAILPSFNGIINGKMTVTPDGAFTYAIPLQLPPGNVGAEPGLELTYSSQSPNGLLGAGFSLSGLSAVTRTGATVPEDGFRGGVNYNANDRFALDGARLMNNSSGASQYFNAGSSYYTEQQSWSNVVANGTAGQGPASFTVYREDGSVAQYNSQVVAQGPAFSGSSLQGSVRKWLISSLTSTTGNTVSYAYTSMPKNLQGIPMNGSANDGTAYPDVISYNGRMIQFLYEPRPDTLMQYSGGAGNSVSVRLKAIQSFLLAGNDTTPVNSYLFSYDSTAPLNISRLATVVFLGKQGGASQPLTFQWTNGASGLVGQTISWNGPGANTGYVADFNGDGITDLAPVSNNAITNIYYGAPGGFTTQPLSGSLLVTPNSTVSDFNGDGLPDLLVPKTGIGLLYYGNGQAFNTTPVVINNFQFSQSCATCQWTADFNGDGLADFLSITGTTGYLYIANGNGFNPVQNLNNLSLNGSQIFVGDVNGDGQADLFSAGNTGGTLYLSDFSHTGSFLPSIPLPGMTISSSMQNNLLADYNSDGLADLLAYTGTQYNLYYSNGQGFNNAIPLNNINLGSSENWLSDFNGDGTMDFYTLNGTASTIYYYAGNRFQAQTGNSPALLSENTWSGDFNGDGIADLFAANTATIYYGGNATAGTIPAANQVPNLVTSINNGINGTYAVQYAPITNAAVYTPQANTGTALEELRTQNRYNSQALAPVQLSPYPYVHTQSARYVVQNYTMADGLGNSYPYSYRYSGSLQDVQAYGWLGFQQTTVTDSSAGNMLTNQYLQLYPATGRVYNSSKYDLSGNLLLQRRTTYNIVADSLDLLPSVSYQVLPATRRNDYYDYGTFAYTTGVNYYYDAFGNVTTLVQLNDTTELYNKVYTINNYINDTSGWHIGYLTSSTLAADSAGNNILKATAYRYDSTTWQPVSKTAWLDTDSSWLSEQYAYDTYGNKVTVVNFAGDTAQYAYDSTYHTFPVIQTSPPNQWNNKLVNTMTYDPAFGKLAIATDANGNTLQTISDQFGRDSLMMGPDSSGNAVVLSQVFYYLNGATGYTRQRLVRNNWNGLQWDSSTVSYDGLNRDIQHSWSGQNHQPVLQKKSYNSKNQVVTASLPFFAQDTAQVSTYQYDPYQRIITASLPGPGGQTILNQYSYTGKQIMIKNAVGSADSTTSYRNFDYYNGGRVTTQRQDEAGFITGFAYDLLGRNTAVTDPGGLITSYTLNSLGDMIATTNPASGNTWYLRNYTSNYYAEVNNTGDTIVHQYDALGREITRQSPTGTISFQYDVPGIANGMTNRCKVILEDTSVYYTYAYDAYHQQVNATLHIGGQDYTEDITYNPDKVVNSLQYPDQSTAQYSYYDNGYLQQVSMTDANGNGSPQNYLTYGQYDAAGNETQLNYGNQTSRTASFNPFGSLAGYSINNANGQTFVNKSYTWNLVNNITAITDSLNASNSELYQYTLNNRLDSAVGSYGAAGYAYDSSGNLLRKDSVVYQYNNQYQVTAGYNNNNPYFTAGYDSNGNLSWRTLYKGQDSVRQTYVYNVYNQLTAVLSGADTLFTFMYNESGNRLIKKDYQQGITTYYISPHYTVYTSADSVWTTKYVCSPASMIAAVNAGAASGGAFSPRGISYLHQNFIGSTVLTTDTLGNTASQVQYAPFGSLAAVSGQDTATYLFGSKELDGSGLYYFDARYYDPVTGRFTTADDRPGGHRLQTDVFNRYAYTVNNPVKYVDPSGHTLGGGIILAVLQFIADIFTAGAEIPEELAADGAMIAARRAAEEETDATFLRALSRARQIGDIDDEKAVSIYQTMRDINDGFSPAERLAMEGAHGVYESPLIGGDLPGSDAYGNPFWRNRLGQLLDEEIDYRERTTATGENMWLDSRREIGNLLTNNVGMGYKFVLSFDDFTLRVGTEALKHAAIEGEGRLVYIAGEVTLQRDGTLLLESISGHYTPKIAGLPTSAPFWRMIEEKGYLQFTRIIYEGF